MLAFAPVRFSFMQFNALQVAGASGTARRPAPTLALTLLAAAALLATSGLARAQTWPTQTVKIIVPFAAGGATDVLARVLTDKLAPALGQPVIAENKPGAGATLGAAQVALAKPDGYTLMMMASSHLIAPALYKDLPYDALNAFVPITRLASSGFVMAVHPGVPAKTVREFVALAKAQPGKLNFGSSGNGGNQHLVAQMFINATGADMKHIPYKGSAQVTTDLIGGQIQLAFMAFSNAIGHIKSGKLRPLAVTLAQRAPDLPDVPTLREVGINGADAAPWLGLVAPRGTPPAVIARIDAELRKLMALPETRKTLDAAAMDVDVAGSEEFAAYVREESTRWLRVARSINLAQ